MKCYELAADYTSEDLETVGWSETEQERVPRQGGYWSPIDAEFSADGRMIPKHFDEMQKLWARCAGKKHKPLQVIGEFSFIQGQNAAFHEPLAVTSQEGDPECVEMLHHAKIWSNIDQAPVNDPKFYFKNILRRIESWDEEETEILGRKPVDGYYTRFATKGRRVLRGSRVEDA